MGRIARILGGWPAPASMLILLVAGLVVFAPGQTTLPPFDRDEARIAQASKQMLETGDFLDIRFQGDPLYEKPAGIYWLQAAAASAFGGVEAQIAAFRLPSYVGAALAVMLTAWALIPVTGAGVAVTAAVMVGSILLLHVEARIGRTDAALLATVLLAQGALARIWLAERSGTVTAALFWLGVAVGIMLDGPLIALPVLGTLAWIMIAERRLPARARLRPGLGLGILVVFVVPWVAAISWVSAGAFWTAFLGGDLLAALGARRVPPGTYFGALIGTFWPFAILIPFAALWVWPRKTEPRIALLLGWILPTWLVFELAPTRLAHYTLITYPAIAALIAMALDDIADRAAPHLVLRTFLVTLFALPALALVLAGPVGAAMIEGLFLPGATVLALLGAIPLVLAGRALWRWQVYGFTGWAALGAVLGYAGLLHFAVPTLETAYIAPRLAAADARWRCGAEGPVALTTFHEPSAIFLLGTDTIVTDGVGAAEALQEGRAALAFVGDTVMMEFAGTSGGRASALERIDGINHATGREVHLTLYAIDRTPGHPCAE